MVIDKCVNASLLSDLLSIFLGPHFASLLAVGCCHCFLRQVADRRMSWKRDSRYKAGMPVRIIACFAGVNGLASGFLESLMFQ